VPSEVDAHLNRDDEAVLDGGEEVVVAEQFRRVAGGEPVHGTPFATWGGAPAVGQPADEPDVAPAVSRLIDDSGIGTQPGRLRVS
jgi:hypothetical protein